jgi:hypothetical protein
VDCGIECIAYVEERIFRYELVLGGYFDGGARSEGIRCVVLVCYTGEVFLYVRIYKL